MKSSDIVSVVVISLLGVALATWAVNSFLGDPDSEVVTFKTVIDISNKLEEPDPEIFNINAINPTVEVYVGSCTDADGDGILSDAEAAACNEVKSGS